MSENYHKVSARGLIMTSLLQIKSLPFLLLACAFANPAPTDILLLGIAGFVVNAATTFQDLKNPGWFWRC